MAITRVQSVSFNSSTSVTAAISPAAGNCLVVTAATLFQAVSISTAGANTSGLWTQLYNGSPGANSRWFSAFVIFGIPAGITGVTITSGAGDLLSGEVLEVSGPAALDIPAASLPAPHTSAFGTGCSTPNLTTTNAADMLVACLWAEGATSFTAASNSFTVDNATVERAALAYEVVTTTGTYSTTGTASQADQTYGFLFALAGGSGRTPPPPLMLLGCGS